MKPVPALEARILLSRSPGASDEHEAWAAAAAPERDEAFRVARRLERIGVRTLPRDEADYPTGLRDLADAPRVLFVRGRLPERDRTVAIVGSRAASPYGLAQAESLAADLARAGCVVVSGLARGIDAAAHRGALAVGGASVAVLPGGLDAVTPRHHAALAESLCVRGGLVSERASGPPQPWVFLERNRLIAALAAVTVVVEAAVRSGALSTAAAARRLRRPVLAVPGDVDRETSRGTHALLRAGAGWCERAGDVLRVLDGGGADAGSRLRAALAVAPRTADELASAAGLRVDETLALLLELEWAGAAEPLPGQRWRRAS